MNRIHPPALNHGYCTNGKIKSEYWSWWNAKKRCTDPTNDHYRRYGGRGIKMCPEWLNSFAAFISHMGPKPSGYTLDRINNDKGYEPGNCRWATHSQQAFNRPQTAATNNRKLTDAQADAIRREYVPFSQNRHSAHAIAKRYGVSPGVVLYALKHKYAGSRT